MNWLGMVQICINPAAAARRQFPWDLAGKNRTRRLADGARAEPGKGDLSVCVDFTLFIEGANAICTEKNPTAANGKCLYYYHHLVT